MSDPEIWSLSYHLLSHMFYYPVLGDGVMMGTPERLSCLNDLSCFEDLQPCLNGFSDALQKRDLEALQVEYVRLFDYRPVCPPYESDYLAGKQKNQIIKKLKTLYGQAGLQCREDGGHDHVIVELEFMHYLYAQESKNEEKLIWRNYQAAFLEDHLLKWLPLFCKRLQENAAEPYQQLGQIANVVCLSDIKRRAQQK